MEKFIKSTIKNSELPKKFLIYTPNLLTFSTENKELENVSPFEIVCFVNSDKSDELHDEIFKTMKECFLKLSIKTR